MVSWIVLIYRKHSLFLSLITTFLWLDNLLHGGGLLDTVGSGWIVDVFVVIAERGWTDWGYLSFVAVEGFMYFVALVVA